jgi:hypothetical protein
MSQPKKKHAQSKPPRVPAWLVLLGIVLAGVTALIAWSFIDSNNKASTLVPIEAQGRAKFVADKTQINLGDVKLGETVQAEFKISNAGDQPLRFTQVPIIQVVEGC